jgi:uncharacterized protein YjbK
MSDPSRSARQVEVEFKLLLADESQRERLLEVLLRPGVLPPEPVIQENRFFDTPGGALRAERLAVRLRREEARWSVTLKGPTLGGRAGPARRAEEEHSLTEGEARAILDQGASPLDAFRRSGRSPLLEQVEARLAGQALVEVAAFTNERTHLPAADVVPELSLAVELDRTSLPGGRTDLELEVELPTGADAEAVELVLRRLLERARIPWKAASSKLSRLLSILDRGPTGAEPS